MSLRTWNLAVGAVVLAWMLGLIGVAAASGALAQSQWLMIHLLGLGAASNAILIWSWYFTESVLRLGRDGGRRVYAIRLVLFNAGALAVVIGFGSRGPAAGAWWAVLAGAIAITVAIAWHVAALLYKVRTALPSRFGPMVYFYVVSGVMLLVGVGFGAALAHGGLPGDWSARLAVAHSSVNLLGWIGLTVLGTLVTLWPTILRTRMADGVERAAKRSLPLLVLALAVVVGGALAGLQYVAAAGLLGYAAVFAYAAWAHADEVRRKPPTDFPALSVLAGTLWLLGTLIAAAVGYASAQDWFVVHQRLIDLAPAFLGGFLAQVLLGALSYLMPVVLGNKPSVTQAGTRILNTAGPARVGAANAGLLVWVLPGGGLPHTLAQIIAIVALASFIPLVLRVALSALAPVAADTQRRPVPARPPKPAPAVLWASGAAGVALVVLAAAIGVGVQPSSVGLPGREGAQAVAATGQTTTVEVRVEGMRFVPGAVEVPRGNRLVINLDNTGDTTHDLVLPDGQRTPRLAPGEQATLDAGVIGQSLQGWCSLPGHRQMGMVFDVRVAGDDSGDGGSGHHVGGSGDRATAPDLAADPGPGFVARDPRLPPAPPERTHKLTLTVRDVQRAVAPNTTATLWTFGTVEPDGRYLGEMPGPTLRGKVGDVFEITLVNDGTIGHSIDFHAGALAPDEPMRTIEPGQSLEYRFTAVRSGIWLYHCSTMPMSLHIANGMFGAVVIDPPDLPRVDREFVIVQSEGYLGGPGEISDADKVLDERPDLVMFNGYANQYDHRPLTAKAGERVRIWVLAAGPNKGTAFHVVGGQFDTVWKEGGYLLRPGNNQDGGSQVLDLAPAQGGFVELEFPEPGRYPFVTHSMADAERGAHGIFAIS